MVRRVLSYISCIGPAAALLLAGPSLLFASDLLLVNGHIYTANPSSKWAQAIAITGSRIDAVGSNDEVMKHKEAKTKVVDLQQRTVLPGLIDSHTHMWMGALALHGFDIATPEVFIEPDKDPEGFVAAIRAYAASHPNEKILFGRTPFNQNEVTHEILDRAVSDRPIVIHAQTEHTLWVNAKALALAGITDKPNADPTLEKYVGRDKAGHPTGVLREAAMILMERALPKQPLDERMAWMAEAAHYMNSYGITSVTNATGDLNELALYDAMRDRGQLTVRVKMAFANVGFNHHLTPQFLADLEKARTTYNDRWVSANLVKFFSDGAGGPPLYEPAEYTKLIVELDKRGYQVITHSLSPGPAKMVLDAYEEAGKVNGPRDRRFRMEHALNVTAEDVPRFAKLGVIASMQPDLCCFADTTNRTNVWQTLLKSGAILAFGSDWPCTFPPDPFSGIQQSVQRAQRQLFAAPNPTATPKFVSPDERLTVEQAVDAYTRGGAYARFSEDYLGSLEPGKEADLVVISQDIFAVPADQIGTTQALQTMVGGKVVFDQMR